MEWDWSAMAAHPAVQSGLVPLGLALVVTGVGRYSGGMSFSRRGAGSGIGLAFLASLWLLAGVPQAAPLGAVQKLALLAATGLVLGMVLDRAALTSRVLRPTAAVLFLTGALWLAWPQLQRATLDWPVAVLALACGAVLAALAGPTQRPAHDGVLLLLVAAGVAGIAIVSGSLVIAQLGVALAAACGGFLVWNWPRARDFLGASVLLGAWLPTVALALLTVLLTPAPSWSMAPLAAVFFLTPVARRLWVPRERLREALIPVYLVILGFVPVVLAVSLALMAESPDDAYYR